MNFLTLKWLESLYVRARTRRTLLFIIIAFTIAGLAASLRIVGKIKGGNGAAILYLNRDMSTGDLTQWTHRDYGLGTDKGGNESGAGYLWYHADVAGRRAAGMTVTPTAQASPAANSDSLYLWEPARSWNYAPTEFWLRTSFFFPSPASSAFFMKGEAPYQPITGDWNMLLELHNDSNPTPNPNEHANIAFYVLTDYPAISEQVGKNPRLALRIAGGNTLSPNIVRVEAPALEFDHWYEFLVHIKLDPGAGRVEWFLDGVTIYSDLSIPTLYTRPSGYVSPSYTSLTLTQYRWHASWISTIYLGPLVVCSTQSCVSNAF